MLSKGSTHIFIFLIRIYQRFISPIKPKTMSCRFHPTCSNYGKMAYQKYGVVKGTKKTLDRLGRCQPHNTESCIDYP